MSDPLQIVGHKAAQGKKFVFSASPAPPTDSKHLLISLRYLRPNYCISRCEKRDKAKFAERVRILTQKTWAELKQSDKHLHGYETIAQLSDRLPPEAPLQAPAIAFRFAGLKPMVGFRNDAIFYVVWFDRDYNLYAHG